MIPKTIIDEINLWIDQKKFGNLQINFQHGKVVNFNRTESIRLEVFFKDKSGRIESSISEAGTNLDNA